MSLDPLLYAPPMVQIHVVAALFALILGRMALWRRSRDRLHKCLGYGWVMAMAATALSSFAILDIRVIGPFSPIHALSVFTLVGLWQGIRAARDGRIARHQKEMRGLYFWAIGVAGLFTFLPGRRMNDIFFAQAPNTGFALMAVLIGGGLAYYAYNSRARAAG